MSGIIIFKQRYIRSTPEYELSRKNLSVFYEERLNILYSKLPGPIYDAVCKDVQCILGFAIRQKLQDFTGLVSVCLSKKSGTFHPRRFRNILAGL